MKVLFVGAHPDDIEHGAGALLCCALAQMQRAREGASEEEGEKGERGEKGEKGEKEERERGDGNLKWETGKELRVKYLCFSKCTDLPRNVGILDEIERVKSYVTRRGGKYVIMDFPNRHLPEYSWMIREILWQELDTTDVVVTHWLNDIHQDHRVIADECMRVFRNKTVLCYECIRSCPGFTPNYYVPMSESEIEAKIELLHTYKTQMNLYYNTSDALWSLARLRGAEIGERYAEAFYAVRVRGDTSCVWWQ